MATGFVHGGTLAITTPILAKALEPILPPAVRFPLAGIVTGEISAPPLGTICKPFSTYQSNLLSCSISSPESLVFYAKEEVLANELQTLR